MKESILFVSVKNVPQIEYSGIAITHKDLLKWGDKLEEAGVDLMKIIVYANRELMSAFMRSLLQRGVGKLDSSKSIIPHSTNNKLPIEEKIEFLGLKVFKEDEEEYDEKDAIMNVFVYEVFNDYYLNSRKED